MTFPSTQIRLVYMCLTITAISEKIITISVWKNYVYTQNVHIAFKNMLIVAFCTWFLFNTIVEISCYRFDSDKTISLSLTIKLSLIVFSMLVFLFSAIYAHLRESESGHAAKFKDQMMAFSTNGFLIKEVLFVVKLLWMMCNRGHYRLEPHGGTNDAG